MFLVFVDNEKWSALVALEDFYKNNYVSLFVFKTDELIEEYGVIKLRHFYNFEMKQSVDPIQYSIKEHYGELKES